MNINIVSTYEELSILASNLLLKEVSKNKAMNCCLATGGSPLGMYHKFVSEVQKKDIDVSQMIWTKLDEWLGMEASNESSCEYFIQKHILKPLHISSENYISINHQAENLEKECGRIHTRLEERPIDLCILGIGKNGHLGLNEPSDILQPYVHVTKLDQLSKQHEMLKHQKVEQGITLGLYEILQAKRILLLVAGEDKKEAFQAFMKKEIITQFPVSFLWLHKHVEVIVLKEITE